MKIHRVAFFAILAAPLPAAAADGKPVFPEIVARQTCQEHMVEEPRMTYADFPERARGREYSAYVVVSYKLDGSGKAVTPRVVEAKPDGLFERTTLSLLARTKFAPGVIRDACTYVRTYGAVRRGGR